LHCLAPSQQLLTVAPPPGGMMAPVTNRKRGHPMLTVASILLVVRLFLRRPSGLRKGRSAPTIRP